MELALSNIGKTPFRYEASLHGITLKPQEYSTKEELFHITLSDFLFMTTIIIRYTMTTPIKFPLSDESDKLLQNLVYNTKI